LARTEELEGLNDLDEVENEEEDESGREECRRGADALVYIVPPVLLLLSLVPAPGPHLPESYWLSVDI
jgi:hypothetical protein